MATSRSSELRILTLERATPEEAAAITIALSSFLDAELNENVPPRIAERWRMVGRLEAHGRKGTDRAIARGWRG